MTKAGKSTKKDSPGFNNKDLLPNLAIIIEQTLESFGITARVAEINKRPKDIEFCLEIALGTSIESITNLHKDLALALASHTGDVEIEAPIPGRSLIAIRLPTEKSWLDFQTDYMQKINILRKEKTEKEKAEEMRRIGGFKIIVSAAFYLIAEKLAKLANYLTK